MGIPNFNKFLTARYQECFEGVGRRAHAFDHLLFDVNTLLHQVVHKSTPQTLSKNLFARLETSLNRFTASKSVYFALDGTVCFIQLTPRECPVGQACLTTATP